MFMETRYSRRYLAYSAFCSIFCLPEQYSQERGEAHSHHCDGPTPIFLCYYKLFGKYDLNNELLQLSCSTIETDFLNIYFKRRIYFSSFNFFYGLVLRDKYTSIIKMPESFDQGRQIYNISNLNKCVMSPLRWPECVVLVFPSMMAVMLRREHRRISSRHQCGINVWAGWLASWVGLLPTLWAPSLSFYHPRHAASSILSLMAGFPDCLPARQSL